jgi:hypothetical protein
MARCASPILTGFCLERIVELDDATAGFESRKSGDTVVNARHQELLSRVLCHISSHSDQGRAYPGARRACLNVGSSDVELIRRDEIVEGRVALRPRIRLVHEGKLADGSGDTQRFGPWIEFCDPDGFKNATEGKIIVA